MIKYKDCTVPKYVLDQYDITTQREWKQLKREQLKKLAEAMVEYRFGCAFCPDYDEFGRLERLLKERVENHSQKNWGR